MSSGNSGSGSGNDDQDPFGIAGIPGLGGDPDSPVPSGPSRSNESALDGLPGIFDLPSDLAGAGGAAPDPDALPSDQDFGLGLEPNAPFEADVDAGAGAGAGAGGFDFNLDGAPPSDAAVPGSTDAPPADFALPAEQSEPPISTVSSAAIAAGSAAAAAAGAPIELNPAAQDSLAAPAAPSPGAPSGVGKHYPLEKVKQYSEQVSATPATVAAAFPFSLMIEGPLDAYEREKLTDILHRENVGILESDLEPQFNGNRVLLPRISEYCGVQIVQALRGARVRMRLGPSDEIFATDETRAGPGELGLSAGSEAYQNVMYSTSSGTSHPAENIPLTDEATLPDMPSYSVVDVLTASALLQTAQVETERSSEYQQILEALHREIKYKAFHKGATAVIRFSVQLVPLALPTNYRLMVTGLAVRAKTSASSSPFAP